MEEFGLLWHFCTRSCLESYKTGTVLQLVREIFKRTLKQNGMLSATVTVYHEAFVCGELILGLCAQEGWKPQQTDSAVHTVASLRHYLNAFTFRNVPDKEIFQEI
jgi:hypothetical protein